MLNVVLSMTGMGFAAVARVTTSRWIACQVLDPVGFGLQPGDELPIESTLCNEIRDHRQVIVIDDAQEDPVYRNHHTPRIYGLRSYISMPIILADGRFFGTHCAIDANPAKLNNPEVLGAFKLFAELIAHHLDADDRLTATQRALEREKELSEHREQFIAVLGHDLRNPLAAIDAGRSSLMRQGWTERSPLMLGLMKSSIGRMSALVDNVLDLARARLGAGISLDLQEHDLGKTLREVVDQLRIANPDQKIVLDIDLPSPVAVDLLRIAQMSSNLASNAVTHGAEDQPVRIKAEIEGGHLEICVINGGAPIAPETVGKLFQPFRRGDAASDTQGLGLGLYIASEIAKAHGGTIDVRSDEMETCFSFRMPLA
nr:ATP-binding protein [Neorhizobium sp. P12A]